MGGPTRRRSGRDQSGAATGVVAAAKRLPLAGNWTRALRRSHNVITFQQAAVSNQMRLSVASKRSSICAGGVLRRRSWRRAHRPPASASGPASADGARFGRCMQQAVRPAYSTSARGDGSPRSVRSQSLRRPHSAFGRFCMSCDTHVDRTSLVDVNPFATGSAEAARRNCPRSGKCPGIGTRSR
jgi:hypothetical protein